MITIPRIASFLLLLFATVLAPLPLLAQEPVWQSLFNGQDLSGWTELNGAHTWEVNEGMIVGSTVPGQPNGFLCTEQEFGDFVLELEVSVDTLMNNSGVQFRSQSYPEYKNGRVHGYQMEVDPKPQQWSGAIYEEGADRGWIYPPEKMNQAAKTSFKRDNKDGYQWNHYRIEAVGPMIRTWVNGVPVAHLVDDRYLKGFIGLQLHANNENDPQGSFSIRFRNIRIQKGSLDLTPMEEQVPVVNLLASSDRSSKPDNPTFLRIEQDLDAGSIAVYTENKAHSILTQSAKPDERPYLHPILAPDGRGELTEYRPAHHPHQTGIYWGLKRVNERDYFMNWNRDYWRRVSADVLQDDGERVRWQTMYEMLDEEGNVLMVETQNWSLQAYADRYVLDLEWQGEAKMDVVMGKFYVGGLFVRMPWVPETVGEIVSASGHRGMELEGQQAIWSDIGIQLDGREDFAHIAILDHPHNAAFPTPWRVDSQMGLGPSRQILGDWGLAAGESETIRYRLLMYTGTEDKALKAEVWKGFFGGE
ncbi:MAG: family 16 glycoside hydrolase [Cyclobacterium sp.]|uniref:family 16 glycoside hydrolase n=1 Tax=Cyclobacterium sp. TaxID=1966343 RepID=UPI003970A012